jgi:enoyl-CoA hydratase/carnithine racemase
MSVIHVERRTLGDAMIALVTLQRPERANAINREVLDALRAQFTALAGDDAVRAIILTGAGERAFSAGADVHQFLGMLPAAAEELMAFGQEVFGQIEDCAKPVIAAINGYALGGGLELALACDFRIAAPHVRLGQPEITLANLPGWGGTQRLPRTIGEPMAKELILTGRLVDAQEALALHLVHQVCPEGALEGALQLAGRLTPHAATALARAKQAIHAARGDGAGSGYIVERQAVALCFGTPDQQAAVQRFVQRRKETLP